MLTLPFHLPDLLFIAAAGVAVVAAVIALAVRHPVYGLISFVVSLLGTAVMLFLAGAPFAAALEIIVYAGAIMVLFVLVVMMVDLGKPQPAIKGIGVVVGAVFLAGILLTDFIVALTARPGTPSLPASVTPAAVGRLLFAEWLLLVELIGVLLLAGIAASWHLARPEPGFAHRYLQDGKK